MSNIPTQNPLHITQDELRLLNYLRVRELSSGQAIAALETPDTATRLVQGVPYQEVPVAEPMPWMPVSNDIAWGLNDRTTRFTAPTANVESQNTMGFDLPSVVYAITATVRQTTFVPAGNTFNFWESQGFASPLDTFQIQFALSQGRTWQTTNAPASTICGSAERPRFLGRTGWRFGQGAVLVVKITPLLANLTIDVVLWAVEEVGGSNIRPTG